ncbi:MAG: hypothetical protein AAGG81_08260, partial [Chlamydiota bacterium]
TVGRAPSLDEDGNYSLQNVQQGRNRPSAGGINLRQLSRQFEGLNALEAQVLEQLMAQNYGAIWS